MNKIVFTDGWLFGLKGEKKKKVLLPHDAMQLQERESSSPSGSGCAYFPGGIYTYEKHWNVPAEYADKKLILHFEGVYRNTTVKVNGVTAAENTYGYTPFWIDITDRVNAGEENLIEVLADNADVPNSRWYSGGGIYRPVWLWVGEKTCISPCGVKVNTLSYDPAVVEVSVDTNADSAQIRIFYGNELVAEAEGLNARISIPDAHLWDEVHPDLYTCSVSVSKDGKIVDTAESRFGIRTIACTPEGLKINGNETLLRGGCIHSDNGVIGAASFPEAEYRKAKLLKDAGYNAIRSAHNPASPALLDACDALGLYVMDEGWDMWYKRKTKYDYGIHFMDNWKKDILAMVDTDYNHPSVIMYSIGNEISEPAEEKGAELAGLLADEFHRIDGTRPVTVGCNLTILADSKKGEETFIPDSGGTTGTFEKQNIAMDSTKFNELISIQGDKLTNGAIEPGVDAACVPLFEQVDAAGYNYGSCRYRMDGELHPDRVIVGSETMPMDIYKNWQLVKELPYLIGDFTWTALDYIGEAGIGAWAYDEDGTGFVKPYPWLLGEAGAIDLIGTPTGELFMAQAAWGQLTAPAIAVSPDVCHPGVTPARGAWRGTNAIPSWSFSGCEGNKTHAEIHSTDPVVELFINGKSLGKKETENALAVYDCVYTPGKIEAVGYDAAGNETGRSSLTSANGETHVQLVQENPARIGSLVYVDVNVIGENGVIESNQDQLVEIICTGGTLLGFGSARARTPERFTDGRYTTYYGRALAAVFIESEETKISAKYNGKQTEIVLHS